MPRVITFYKVVYEKDIQAQINAGWQPYGSPIPTQGSAIRQAMVLYGD